MKYLLRIEEAAMTLAAIYFLFISEIDLPVWAWILLFLSPDIGMVGYLFGNKTGAVCYNLFHHKGLALAIAFAGCYVDNEIMKVAGILLFAHSSFDRIMGYGLKYFTGFKHTHLGSLEKNKPSV